VLCGGDRDAPLGRRDVLWGPMTAPVLDLHSDDARSEAAITEKSDRRLPVDPGPEKIAFLRQSCCNVHSLLGQRQAIFSHWNFIPTADMISSTVTYEVRVQNRAHTRSRDCPIFLCPDARQHRRPLGKQPARPGGWNRRTIGS